MVSDKVKESKDDGTLGPGERLRAARLRNGLEIKWVAGQLHIKEWMVEAMEANEFNRITPPVFVRGYLSNYARFIGEPVDEIMTLYKQCSGCGSVEVERVPFHDFSHVDANHPGMKFATWGIILLIASMSVIWGVNKFIDLQEMDLDSLWGRIVASIPFVEEDRPLIAPPVRTPARFASISASETEAEAETETEEANDAAGGSTLDLTQTAEEQVAVITPMAEETPLIPYETLQDSATLPKGKEIIVELTGTSWIDVKDSTGEFKLLGEMKEGESHRLGGTPPYRLLFGRGDSVKLLVDGESYDFSAHQKGAVAVFTYDPEETAGSAATP